MPRKLRELIRDLEVAGFVNRGGKGSHRNFVHPNVKKPVVLSGNTGSDVIIIKKKRLKKHLRNCNHDKKHTLRKNC